MGQAGGGQLQVGEIVSQAWDLYRRSGRPSVDDRRRDRDPSAGARCDHRAVGAVGWPQLRPQRHDLHDGLDRAGVARGDRVLRARRAGDDRGRVEVPARRLHRPPDGLAPLAAVRCEQARSAALARDHLRSSAHDRIHPARDPGHLPARLLDARAAGVDVRGDRRIRRTAPLPRADQRLLVDGVRRAARRDLSRSSCSTSSSA